DVIDMNDIRVRMRQSTDIGRERTLSGRVAELDLQRSSAALAYERAKDDRWFDHVEISAKDGKDEKVYGVAVAFNLPFASAPDLSRVNKEIGEIRDKVKAIETAKSSRQLYQSAISEIETLLSLHQTLSSREAKMGAERLRKASQAVVS